nr:alkaline phosphatase [Algoriphagus sp.]
MKKISFALLFSMLFSLALFAQQQAEKPKIVVGIIVDQMRQEYFYKFADRYSDGGFKRLASEGYMMKNGHYR